MTLQFAKFILAGGLAALVNFGSRFLLSEVFTYAISIVIAYCIGMITAFILNRIFVFEVANGQMHRQFLWFTLVNIAAVTQTLLISLVLAKVILPWMGLNAHAEELAHLVGIIVPVFSSYLGHKYLSFAR